MKKVNGDKVRRSESEWRDIFKRHAGSGLSNEAFCEKEGIAKSSFSKWRKRLKCKQNSRKGGFVEVLPEKSEQPPLRVEIQFPNGSVLRVC